MFKQVIKIGLGLVLMLAGFNLPAQAAEPPKVPDVIDGTTRISAEDVFRLADTIPNLVIIDSRLADGPSSGRAQGFIEGSISLPDTQTNCGSLARIVPKKNTPTLYYCNGVKCGRSVTAIRIALTCGYNNIYWFRGGFEEWRDKGYPIVKP